jgi:hypothetical protein
MSASDLTGFEAGLQSDGYTITQHFTQNGTTADGYPIYSGMATKSGYNFAITMIQTDSSAHAQAQFGVRVAAAQSLGFSGSYTNSQTWSGSMTDPTTGNQMGAVVFIVSAYPTYVLSAVAE